MPVGTIWSLGGSDLNVGSNTAIDFGNLTLMGGAVRLQNVSDVFLETCAAMPATSSAMPRTWTR